MNALTLPLRNLLGQPIRSALTILGVAFAVGGFIALKGLTFGLENAISHSLEEPGADLVVSQRGAFSLVNSSVPGSLGPTFSAVDGVDVVSPALLNVTEADNEANVVISGWPLDSAFWRGIRLTSGRIPSGEHEWETVLGESLANALNKHVGDQIELQYQPYRIAGIATFETVLNQNMALVPLAGLQQLVGREGTVTLYQIRLKRPLDTERMSAVRARISAAVPNLLVTTTEEFAHDVRLFRVIQAFASTISIVVLVMALIAVANTLLMAVNERTHELGILAAIGWTPARTLGLILLEGLVITAFGGLLGIALGMAVMDLVSFTRIASGLLEPHLTLALVVQAMISVFAIGPLGALYPAWRAIRLTPAAALRRI